MPRFFLFNISMYCLLFGLPFQTVSLYFTELASFILSSIRWFYQEVCLIINICRNCLLSLQRQKFWRVESEVRPQEAEPRVRTNSGMGWSGTGRRMSLPGRDYLVGISMVAIFTFKSVSSAWDQHLYSTYWSWKKTLSISHYWNFCWFSSK